MIVGKCDAKERRRKKRRIDRGEREERKTEENFCSVIKVCKRYVVV